MKNVERIEGTDFYGLHTGNHGKIGDPHPQYGQKLRKAGATSTGTMPDSTTAADIAGMGFTFTVPVDGTTYEVAAEMDLETPGGVTVYVATLYLGSVAQSPNLAVQVDQRHADAAPEDLGADRAHARRTQRAPAAPQARHWRQHLDGLQQQSAPGQRAVGGKGPRPHDGRGRAVEHSSPHGRRQVDNRNRSG
ncbi:hypothetical protein [Rhodococcus sp. IEGM 1307]|uniref:hypothetical protein n=1 Tax=Rhodococcus sp. IEGM 1307 TaxID=3047091 RepID=UPI0024B7B728|nr:hypothetical protein [Rhodococcus sp. IEGM 1307]MDI9973236.1 hypothetical protein [Rhodococcus sp. IEGM 1307]